MPWKVALYRALSIATNMTVLDSFNKYSIGYPGGTSMELNMILVVHLTFLVNTV